MRFFGHKGASESIPAPRHSDVRDIRRTVPPPSSSGVRLGTSGLPSLWSDDDAFEGTETTALPSTRPMRKPRLRVVTGPRAGEVFSLEGRDAFVVGRSHSAELMIADAGVSRVHCRFVFEDDGELTVQDLASQNGVLVNGARVSSARLRAGDRIQLGPNVVLQLGAHDDSDDTLARRLSVGSTRDRLTRAYDRRSFADRLHSEVELAGTQERPLGVLILDLDRFKSINDRFGNAAGDAVLRSVVEAITSTVRDGDFLTRYGGDEFALLVRSSGVTATARLAERLRTRIESMQVTFEDKTLRTTVSIGVAELSECGDAAKADALLRLAERRVYRAKLLGRNRVHAGDTVPDSDASPSLPPRPRSR